MKRFPYASLLLMVFLGGLLVYVAEDIPKFGDPYAPTIQSVKLFDIPADGPEEDLNRQVIPKVLQDLLEARKLPKPSRIEMVPGSGHAWNAFVPKSEMHYAQDEKYYLITKEGSDLVVSRYAFVVRWIEKGLEETGVPNMVTYGLADYRGYDTLGETSVIFTAGVSVILLLRRRGRL